MHINRKELVRVKPSPRDFISLREGSCDGCGACVVICPMDLWKVRKGRASLSRSYRQWCLECGSCYLACPRGAVEFSYPPPGTGVTYERS
ncbi:MAG: 4Fe-4S dicluster domain-containing protein [Actinomycetota bacterium]